MECPQCHHRQRFAGATECERCGVVFARVRVEPASPGPAARDEPQPRAVLSSRLQPAGLRAAALGLGLAILTQVWPLLQMLIQYLVVLVHEIGHAAAGWLFGFPSLPAFDFLYGGGVTSHGSRWWLLVGGVIAGLAWAGWQLRARPWPRLALAGAGASYVLLLSTGGDAALILMMGHGAELLFAALFLFRALTGSGCQLAAERPLYAWIGLHIVLFDLRFAHGLITSAAERASYGAAKGGGHWMDFSRLADLWGLPLEAVAGGFAALCLAPIPCAFLAARRLSGPTPDEGAEAPGPVPGTLDPAR